MRVEACEQISFEIQYHDRYAGRLRNTMVTTMRKLDLVSKTWRTHKILVSMCVIVRNAQVIWQLNECTAVSTLGRLQAS